MSTGHCQGLEILKTDYQTHSLHCTDLDGDGVDEILFANRARGSIDVMSLKNQNVAPSKSQDGPDLNQLHFNHRWETESIPVNRDIYALKVLDLNNDQKPDIIYHGAPGNVVVLINEPDGHSRFKLYREIETPPALHNTHSLIVRSLPDGDSEIVVQHENQRTHLLLDKKLKIKDKVEMIIPRSSKGKFRAMHWGSLKNGSKGLWVQQNDSKKPLLFYKHIEGLLYDYPEKIDLKQTRFLVSGHFRKSNREEFIQVRTQKGQLSIVDISKKDRRKQLKRFPFFARTIPYANTGSNEFVYLLHDINHDQQKDLVIAHKESAQLEIFFSEDGTFKPGKLFPCYKAADFLIPHPEGVLIASKTEGLIGLSKFDGERLLFPVAKHEQTTGEVMAFLLHQGQPDNYAQLIKKEEKVHLKWKDEQLPLQVEEPYPVTGLMVHLKNGKYPELILEIPYQGIRIFGWDDTLNTYTNLVNKLSFLKEDELSNLSLGAIEFIPSGNGKTIDLSLSGPRMIRQYRFTDIPQIIEQVNFPNPNSKSSLHSYVDLDGDQIPELVSYDNALGKIDIFTKDDIKHPYRWESRLNAPKSNGTRLMSISNQKNQKNDLILAGKGEFQWYSMNTKRLLTATPKALPYKDENWAFSYFGTSLSRKSDGLDSLILLDNRMNYLTMLSWHDNEWKKDYSFPIFNTDTFRKVQSLGNARELIATGTDNNRKLMILVHDRILIYDWKGKLQ